MTLQLSMLFEIPPRTSQAREADEIYNAILTLRRRGNRVYKIGFGQHFYNGSIRTSLEIMQMAGTP